MAENKRILVPSALPYANGPLHLGHLAGAYLTPDLYVRYKRLTGADVVYICGSDEHGAAKHSDFPGQGGDPLFEDVQKSTLKVLKEVESEFQQ